MATQETGANRPPLLALRGISKRYGGVRALEGVEFTAHAGSIHAILGENGAGKSTLIKIIAGVVQPDAGTLAIDGTPRVLPDPQAANAAGVVCVFQELSLLPDLSVADNIAITTPPRRFGLIDRRAQRRNAEKLLARVGCEDINPIMLVRDLPLSRRQMVEIAKALGRAPRLLILDEGDIGADRGRRRKGLCNPAGFARRGAGVALHQPPDARDREAGRRLLGVPQRPPYRDVRAGLTQPRRYRSDDDRPRHPQHLSAQTRLPCEQRAGTGCEKPLPGPTGCMGSTCGSAGARSSASAGSMGRVSATSCSRCSACCAASPAPWRSTASRAQSQARPRPRIRAFAWR